MITLTNPIYKQNNKDLYCDLSEMTNYFGGKVEFSANHSVGMVEINEELITFSSRIKVATIANPKTGKSENYNLSCSVNTKSNGLDVPIDDYSTILNYSHTIEDDIYVLSKKRNF